VSGALVAVGLLSVGDAKAWRAEVWRAGRAPEVADGESLEAAAAALRELLDVAGLGEAEEQLARIRLDGALQALTEVGAVDREEWNARSGERWPSAQAEGHFH